MAEPTPPPDEHAPLAERAPAATVAPAALEGEAAALALPAGLSRSFSLFVWRNKLPWFLALVVLLIAADQGSKYWAQHNLTIERERTVKQHVDGQMVEVKEKRFYADPESEVHVIPSALSFRYAENPAAAFSLTGSIPQWFRLPFLVIVSSLAMLFISVWYFRQRRPDGLLMTAFALIIAGAMGNFIDRVRLSYVIDFINMYAGFINPRWPPWPTYNVADMCIVGGALSVIYRTLRPLYPELELGDDREESPGAAEAAVEESA